MDGGSHRHAARALIAGAVTAIAMSGCGSSSQPKVPASFEPQAIAVRGARNYWLLGSVPCHKRRCFAIVRTTDGGRRFTRAAAPALPITTTGPSLRPADSPD